MTTKRPPRVTSVKPLHDFVVQLSFTDGVVREVDLLPYLRGPVFEEMRTDPVKFRDVHVDAELGTIVWPNGADIDPDVLYGSHEPAWRTDVKTL